MELFFAQGAGRSVFPSERLKLGHKGADGSLHDAENKTEADRTISTQALKSKIDVPTWWLISPDECCMVQTENTSQRSDHHTFTYIRFILTQRCTDQRKKTLSLPSSPPSSHLTSSPDFIPLQTWREKKKKLPFCPPKDKIVLMVAETHPSLLAEQGI